MSGVLSLEVASLIDAAVVRAMARSFATGRGFTLLAASQIAIAAGELATNIAKYAKQGRITLKEEPKGVLLCAEDQGAGIKDLPQALRDGFCNGAFLRGDERDRRGLGCGLGAVLRLMDQVEFSHPPGGGLKVHAWKWKSQR